MEVLCFFPIHGNKVTLQIIVQFVIDNQVLSCINKEACWTISNITAGNKGEIQVVLDAHNGLTSIMKPRANWVDMQLLEWMYVFYGVRKIWEGWGVLYGEVHEKRMHYHFFSMILAFVMGLAFLLGSGEVALLHISVT